MNPSMEPEAIRTALAALPHFQSLPPVLLERLAAIARPRELGAGEQLFTEGDRCDAFYAILAGGVRLYRTTPDGERQVLHDLGPPRTFAEAALLNMKRYPASAEARTAGTRLLRIDGQPFLELLEREPRMRSAVIASLSVHLMRLAERVEELSIPSAEARLARYVLRQPARAGRQISLGMKKKDLAAHLAMVPETLSRTLRRWRERDWVADTRGAEGPGLEILDEEPLLKLAHPDGDGRA